MDKIAEFVSSIGHTETKTASLIGSGAVASGSNFLEQFAMEQKKDKKLSHMDANDMNFEVLGEHLFVC